MKQDLDPTSDNNTSAHTRWIWRAVAAGTLIVLIALLHSPHRDEPAPGATSVDTASASASTDSPEVERARRAMRRPSSGLARTAEEIVASKVNQFCRSRREIVRGIARRSNKAVPPEIEKFFDAIELGRWEEIEAQWHELAKRSGQYESSTDPWPDLNPFWMAVLDAYGVAEQAHEWPAQKLLDYGNTILDSLRPGMVYVGGTDNGRWIPELLNETSGGEPHIIVTQNAMADGRYLEYMNTLYDGSMSTLTSEDSQRAFQEYLADAQKRLDHDQRFPDEPKQIRPGEDLRVIDGKVQVSGQTAVMAINEKLLQLLMAKNPELSFAIQESFPLRGTYADALPLGPLMELGARDGQNTFTPERAAQSLDYWRKEAQQILADPDAAASESALKSYSHDAVSAAHLLAAHDFTAEAEQAYRLAAQLWPENPESIGGLAEMLSRSGRENEARLVLEEFSRQHPNQQKELERIRASTRVIYPARAPHP